MQHYRDIDWHQNHWNKVTRQLISSTHFNICISPDTKNNRIRVTGNTNAVCNLNKSRRKFTAHIPKTQTSLAQTCKYVHQLPAVQLTTTDNKNYTGC